MPMPSWLNAVFRFVRRRPLGAVGGAIVSGHSSLRLSSADLIAPYDRSLVPITEPCCSPPASSTCWERTRMAEMFFPGSYTYKCMVLTRGFLHPLLLWSYGGGHHLCGLRLFWGKNGSDHPAFRLDSVFSDPFNDSGVGRDIDPGNGHAECDLGYYHSNDSPLCPSYPILCPFHWGDALTWMQRGLVVFHTPGSFSGTSCPM